ncbi:hypothetical protein VTK73DRAFT_9886 [Phialemonium thermophilum]|uniref:Secreted protein n=1 Tax=Phialemonium thermophilum TaxID=223376 RepID=A0ABR3W004_9PEZI
MPSRICTMRSSSWSSTWCRSALTHACTHDCHTCGGTPSSLLRGRGRAGGPPWWKGNTSGAAYLSVPQNVVSHTSSATVVRTSLGQRSTSRASHM